MEGALLDRCLPPRVTRGEAASAATGPPILARYATAGSPERRAPYGSSIIAIASRNRHQNGRRGSMWGTSAL